jgi:hypothetical protein
VALRSGMDRVPHTMIVPGLSGLLSMCAHQYVPDPGLLIRTGVREMIKVRSDLWPCRMLSLFVREAAMWTNTIKTTIPAALLMSASR